MKKILYPCSALVLISSFGLAGGRSLAAHSHAMMSVQLCTSTPYGVSALQGLAQGIRNGATMATKEWQTRMKSVGINLMMPLNMDDAKSDGSTYGTDQERQNALTCIGKNTALGYVGPLNSGAGIVSEPITNRAFLTQISPANTNTSLTDPKLRSSQEPSTYSHQLPYVTYYRTVTTDALQGPVGAQFMKNSLAVKKYFLVDDKATYGAGLAASMDRFAKSLGMTRVGQGHLDPTDSSTLSSTGDAVADQIVSANPDAVYCGCDSENALAFVKTLRQKGYKKPLMGGDALVNTTWTVKLGASAAQNFATSVGPDPARTASGFLTRYHKMFGSFIPQAYDATSYDAANIELNAIYHAAKAHQLKGGIKQMRRVVTKWVSQTRWYGATGLTTFDRNGDTTNRLISVYGVRGGSWKYLFVKKVTGINPTG